MSEEKKYQETQQDIDVARGVKDQDKRGRTGEIFEEEDPTERLRAGGTLEAPPNTGKPLNEKKLKRIKKIKSGGNKYFDANERPVSGKEWIDDYLERN